MTETAEKPPAEVVRLPLMSGHCSTHRTQPMGQPLTDYAAQSHERCNRNGAGNRANPWHEYQPCPCPHHYLGPDGEQPERFECSACGKEIIEVPDWPKDEDGDSRYSHVDSDGRALGEECHAAPPKRTEVVMVVSGNDEPEPEPVVYEAAVVEFDDDLSDLDDEDDFSDLDDL